MKSKQPKTNMKKFSFIWLGLCQQDETEKQDVNPKILPSTSEKNKLNSNSMSKSKSNNLKKIRGKSEKIRENPGKFGKRINYCKRVSCCHIPEKHHPLCEEIWSKLNI